jgi:hypothetical protein
MGVTLTIACTYMLLNLMVDRFEFVFTPVHGSWLKPDREFLRQDDAPGVT